MSDINNRSDGLQFRRLDLHVHTPASADFKGDVNPEEIVAAALDKGLDGIAITDHNSGNWIDLVKKAAEDTDLTVIPGVEITCMGGEKNIHVIALFDTDKTTEYVNAVLSDLKIKPAERGKVDSLVKMTPIDVIDIIQNNWGGVAILAHANSTSGVLGDMKGQQRIEVLNHAGLIGAEGTDFENEEKKKNRKRVVDLLDGTDQNYKLKIGVYQASDNPCNDNNGGHCIEGIGKRSSYFKLEEINLAGLTQCLVDPDVRIRQDYEIQNIGYPKIKKIKVSGGFLGGLEVPFHDGLNSVLGGKGAGKSVLVELMRFCLNQPPVHPDILRDHKGKLQDRLGEYEFVELTFVDETGREFDIKRTFLPIDDSPYNDLAFDPAQVFPVLFLSQNEIIKIAENEEEQLGFIDSFFDFRSYKNQIHSIEEQLGGLDQKMALGLQSFPKVNMIESEIRVLEIEIGKLDKSLEHPLFEKYKEFEQKNLAFNTQSKHFHNLRDTTKSILVKLADTELPDLPNGLIKDPALRRNLDTLKRAQQIISDQMTSLSKSLENLEQSIAKEQEAWIPQYEKTKQDYENYIQEAGGDYKTLAVERTRKFQQIKELNEKLVREKQKRDNVTPISKQRESLLDKLDDVYTKYTKERQSKCEKFQQDAAGRLKLRILGSSNVDEFRQRLLNLKRGSYLKDVEIESLCEHVKPRDFIIALLRFAASGSKQSKHLKYVSDKAEIPLKRMTVLANFLIEAIEFEELLALQYKAAPQDRPEILYNIGEDNYEPLNSVSVGQKSIALLLMALSDGSMPVVIDQPEDSLDIRSIWDDVCMKIRKGKELRQFIFTTHSSSVAVASDSDYFIIMEGTASNGTVLHSGSMDNPPVSDEVLLLLEGGIEAYRRKHLKYQAEKRLEES